MSADLMTTDAPAPVQQALAFVQRADLWHIVSRNSPATSCRDAAARRWRLGKQGIPLYDELKSLCLCAHLADGVRHVLLHARAHTRLNLAAAAQLLGATEPLTRVSQAELADQLGSVYGTVNPFCQPERFIHLFDQDVLAPYTAPHTMLTNAGEHTWAIEFVPGELVQALRAAQIRVVVGNISARSTQAPCLPRFGILTGNGPESGMALWQHINTTVFDGLQTQDQMYGDLSYPSVVVHSLPEMGLSMQLVEREAHTWQVVAAGVDQLCAAGITHLALACNTTPYFTEQIRARCAPHGVTFIPIQEPTISVLARYPLSELTILGIPVVAGLGPHSAYRALADQGVAVLDNPKVLAALHELGYLVKRFRSRGQHVKALNKLRYILRAGVQTPRALIALTEISVLLERFPGIHQRLNSLQIIDPLAIYGAHLGQLYLSALPDEAGDAEED
ncbi:MAG: YbaK/EbsC family protein [Pseudomonadota bacterium]